MTLYSKTLDFYVMEKKEKKGKRQTIQRDGNENYEKGRTKKKEKTIQK